jgi:hypothetical protein
VLPANNARYDGEWVIVDGARVRQGRGVYVEGSQKYEGQFVKDVFHGTGKMNFASGAVYEGEWEHGLFNGKGRYVWPDGSSYDGTWRANKMHGQGVYKNAKGQEFHGEFANGVAKGLQLPTL